jgi:beta-lactamase regulating signal transducer with metallopeptidase domain
MNTIGVALVWCVIQVTILAGVASLAYAVVRRYGPSARALTALAGLLLIAGLTALTFSPWPRWKISAGLAAVSTESLHTKASSTVAAGSSRDPADGAISDERSGDHPQSSVPTDAVSPTAEFFKTLLVAIQRRPAVEKSRWEWPAYAAILFLIGAGVGLARLMVGLATVRSYRLRAQPITDSSLLELADVLLAEVRGPKAVVICESNLLTTPATVGWRRPLIILPADWRNWTSEERRAVLAHELAHVARQDFATWIAAQLALVFHFYHPLVHWLAARLRLEQELAADAAAAQITGGQRLYLTTLAGMALRHSDRPLAWPARTFLPTRGTFMRRIEMLRDEKLISTKITGGFRTGMVAGLAAIGLAVAGLRGTAADRKPAFERQAVLAAADDKQSSGSQTKGAAANTISSGSSSSTTTGSSSSDGTSGSSTAGAVDSHPLAWVPRDSIAVVRLRPAELLNRPTLANFKKSLLQQKDLFASLGIAPDRIEQVTIFAMVNPAASGRPMMGFLDPSGVVVRLSDAADAPALLKALQPQPEQQEFAGMNYVRGRDGRGPICFQADPRTVAISGREEFMRRMIVAGKIGASRAKWAEVLRSADHADVAALVNTATLREMLKQAGALSNVAFSALWDEASTTLATLEYRKELTMSLSLAAENPQARARIRDTLAALVTFSQNLLSQDRNQFSRFAGDEAAFKLRAADMFDALLDSVKITTTESQVRADASLDADEAAAIAAVLVPAIGKARESAQRSQSINNLKQLGLAMYNYHNTHNSLPPAVLYGPDGKTPYSWRVALLPFLGEEALYEQYKKDEPWDGPNNKQLLAKMPAVFRDPTDPANTAFTSYFGITGPSTVFSGKEGIRMLQITDGTSNTLQLVEAKRDVPWTKPEDIPFAGDPRDEKTPLPKFGGHYPGVFLAAMCDGAVRVFANDIDPKLLRALITRAGGEAVQF